MRTLFLAVAISSSLGINAQVERDTLLSRCPVFITDTVSSNNFFIEFQKTTLKVYRNNGNLTINFTQKEQYLTLFFNTKKLRNGKYNIVEGEKSKSELNAKYSFRSGDQVSYVDVGRGTVEVNFDKDKNMWHLKLLGQIANMVERSVSYFRVKADFFIK